MSSAELGIRFNRLIHPVSGVMTDRVLSESALSGKTDGDKLVFMSHKTGDPQAEKEAKYISNKHHVYVYMAEWDDSVHGDSYKLPEYIMNQIRNCDGFLVNVTDEIAVSMWIGYEIGGAHAMEKPRAKIMYKYVRHLPSVVGALNSLHNRDQLDKWVIDNVRSTVSLEYLLSII